MDKIGDLINRIATANPNAKEIVVPNSKQKREILKVLYEEGWIAGITEKREVKDSSKAEDVGIVKELTIFLKKSYIDASNSKWTNIHPKFVRISKPGRRIYSSAKENQRMSVKGSNISNTIVVSTSKGIMTAQKAAMLNVGGELMFKIHA